MDYRTVSLVLEMSNIIFRTKCAPMRHIGAMNYCNHTGQQILDALLNN